MVIYNVTVLVDWKMHDEWFEWMTDVHIPEIMQTNLFQQYQLARLKEVDEETGPTYCVQFFTTDEKSYKNYIEKYAPFFSKRNTHRWGTSVVSFGTMMEVVK